MAATYILGPFRLDAETDTLFRGGEPVSLGHRAVALLRVLVEQRGIPVSTGASVSCCGAGPCSTFTGLLTGGSTTANIGQVVVEIYQVFPNDSNVGRTSGAPVFSTNQVPTRLNSPSDVALDSRRFFLGIA
jgi:hypothetical protein